MTDKPEKLAYTIQEAASAIGVSKPTIYRAIRKGDLRMVKYLGRSLIRAEDLKAALDRAAHTAPA